jgi:lipoprotein-anchoring transpeptidase ErfK/SrfK
LVRKPDDTIIGHVPIRTQLAWCEKEGVDRAAFTHLGSEIVEGDEEAQRAQIQELAEERGITVSTGLPSTPTPTGQFRIWIKLRYDDMSGPDYYLEDVPYVMYFYQGYGFHGTFWHTNFGHQMSHGCVNLPTEEAGWLFEFADIGTLVNVHE